MGGGLNYDRTNETSIGGGTTMTDLEKKAYAYATKRQEDPNYPTYNWETEISDAYEQGYKDAIDKALEWWKEELTYPSISAEEIAWIDAKIEDFKKFMEEQE